MRLEDHAPIVRCDQWSCRTTVDLNDDPQALRPCGHTICAGCTFCDCQDGAT